ncbi:MAG: RNA polymerase sigma factor [Pseudomonadales bacterium]
MKKADFDALYREHYPRVFGLCRRLLGDAADAEDAAQEVFMRGYRAIRRYRSGDPFGPWIGAIASNYCVDLLRRRRRLAGVFLDGAAEVPEPVDPEEHGSAALISAHDAGAIARAVEALPEHYRLPVVLAYYGDASYEDIANTLDITANHVGVLLLRARKQLRLSLADLDEEN